ncbi:HTH domain-containing protein [Corynebacterium sp. P3-F1]|uniref:helix-turn-helix transcriptional regulator n=1 Tax=Corynebacterium sp. P3-F1 TaxID=3059080 RepID=UPI00265D46E7|nr:HTH domain-containing protein [Corynebacterium sp. P3-F1]WKK62212.1 HTH domain-containing protein [Corynebacterium sp. P3-F1]
MFDPFDSPVPVSDSPHPLEEVINKTEKYQRREKIPAFLRGAELLRLLQTGMVLEGRELAEKVGVDRRTLRRYIAYLRDLGFLIESRPGASGRYAMGRGDIMPPLSFTDDELEVLILALSSVGYPGDELVVRAGALSQRIKQFLPLALAQSCEAAGRLRFYDTMRMWSAYDREQRAKGAEN